MGAGMGQDALAVLRHLARPLPRCCPAAHAPDGSPAAVLLHLPTFSGASLRPVRERQRISRCRLEKARSSWVLALYHLTAAGWAPSTHTTA